MEKAILVNLATTKREKEEAEESMIELAGLASAAGAEVADKIFQNRPRISPRYFLGEGKVNEILQLLNELEAEVVIFDHNLTPIQQRSLEDSLKVKVVDRTQLILDIFAQRARSNEGKLQVELAQLSYLLPRLTGKGMALSRLGAGIRTRGPGEKKLETDRRRINDRIVRIKKEIRGIQKRRSGQRQSRRKSPVPTLALVGYTSAGKSTLFNFLTRERRYTSPELFATLDPVLRRVSFSDGLHFFLSDTVGFIRKLPVELVSSFHATLEELREADAICHVIDTTNPGSREQAAAVEAVLSEVGAAGVPVIRAFNKIDLLPDEEREDLFRRNKSSNTETLYVSARTGEGVEDLKRKMRELLFSRFRLFYLQIPSEKEEIVHSLPQRSLILKKRQRDDLLEYKVMADPAVIVNFLPYLDKGGVPW